MFKRTAGSTVLLLALLFLSVQVRADEAIDRARLEEQMKREAELKRLAEQKEREKMTGQRIVDPASGKVLADLSALEKQAADYEARGNREAAAKIRAQIEELRKRFAVAGPQPVQPPQDPKVLAKIKEMLEKAAELEKAGRREEAAKLRAEIAALQAGSGPAVDRSSDLKLTVTAPARVALGEPVKPTVTIALNEPGPMNMPVPTLQADCLAETGSPRISFEVWHADGKPVVKRVVEPPAAPPPPRVAPKPDEPSPQPEVVRPAPVPADSEPALASVPGGLIFPLKRGEKYVLSDSPHFKPLTELYVFDRPGKYTFQVRYQYSPAGKTPAQVRLSVISDPVDVEVFVPASSP